MVAPGGGARRPGAVGGHHHRRPPSPSSSSPSPLRSATLVAAAAIALGALLLPLPVPDDPLMSPKGYAPSNVPALVAEYDQLRAAGATTPMLRAALARHVVPLALGVPLPEGPPSSATAAAAAASDAPHPPAPPSSSSVRSSSSSSSSLEAGVDAFAVAAARELDRPRALARCPLWDGSLPRVLRPPLRRSVEVMAVGGSSKALRTTTLSSRDLARREAEEAREAEALAVAAARAGGEGGGGSQAPSKPPTFVLASNQYNSEAIMPNFIAQVLHLALGNEAVLDPPRTDEEEEDEEQRSNRTAARHRQRRSSTSSGHPLLSAPGQLRVSVYESGSRDSTPQWLELLELLLEAVGVPARVVAGGALRRGQGRGGNGGNSASNDRIAFLARVRNAALAPLARPPFPSATTEEDQAAAIAEQAEAAAIARRVGGYSPLRRRRRLQATAAAAGLAAADGGGGASEGNEALGRRKRRGEDEAPGGDYADADDEGGAGSGGGGSGKKGAAASSSKGRRRHGRKGDKADRDDDQDARDRPPLAPTTPWADGGASGSNNPPAAPSSSSPPPSTTPGWRPDYLAFANDVFFCAQDVVRLSSHRADAACGLDVWRVWGNVAWAREALAPPLEFYDFWVSRDADGRRFEPSPPHLPSRMSADAQRKGLPFRAQCCWNGLVVLDAAPFLGGGGGGGTGGGEAGGALRFRARVLAPSFEGSETAALAAERGEDEDDDKGERREEKEAQRRREEEEEEEEERERDEQHAAPSSSSKPPQPSARERRRLERERQKKRKAAQRLASLPEAGECDASECSLLCDDLVRLGKKDVVVDPGVRVAYFWAVSRELAAGGGEMWRPTKWADVEATIKVDEDDKPSSSPSSLASAVARGWRRWRNGGLPHWRDMGPPGGPDRTECCPKVGPHVVPFNNCRMEPLAAEALMMMMPPPTPVPVGAGGDGGGDKSNGAPNAASAAPGTRPTFVNYTAAAMERWWKVSPGPKGGPPVRDCGLGLAEEAAAVEEEDEGRKTDKGGKAPPSSSSSGAPPDPAPPSRPHQP